MPENLRDIDALLVPVTKVNRDIITAIKDIPIDRDQARFLVDMYYTIQKARIQSSNRVSALERDEENDEPHLALSFFVGQFKTIEENIKRALKYWVDGQPESWFFDQTLGIGPVISAGLLAHIDIERAKTAGAIWRFAGLDPTVKWEKGQKRPWNTPLKTLCWKLGESFVKVHNRPNAFYGHLYAERKQLEEERNAAGQFKDQAAQQLKEKKIGKDTDAFKHLTAGHLPPAQIYLRAKRYAVKIFLSHLHETMYEERFGKPAPVPYVIAHGGHTHYLARPQARP